MRSRRWLFLLLVSLIWSVAFPSNSGAQVFLGPWGGVQGYLPGQFNVPQDVDVDPWGNVYVVDRWNGRIQKFAPDGTFIRLWGSYGASPGYFAHAVAIACDAEGRVYVSDRDNCRVQKFDSDGNFILQFGGRGSGEGQMAFPDGIAVDADNTVLVTDSGNNRIQRYTSNGDFIEQWGSFGSGPGQLDYPFDVATAGGFVFVTDWNNHRIQKYTSAGQYVSKWGYDYYIFPSGIDADSEGHLLVMDANRCQLEKRDLNGNLLQTWGTTCGSGYEQFGYAYGMCADGHGLIYVADTGNHRIQRLGDLAVPSRVSTWGRVKSFRP